MKHVLFALAATLATGMHAAPVEVRLDAPAYVGQRVFLSYCSDLVTPHVQPLTDGVIGADGKAVLRAEVEGTSKAYLRIGDISGELFLRTGTYHVHMPAPGPGVRRSVNRTAKVPLEFTELDPLDVNMLTTDLYERLDAFVAGSFTRADGTNATDSAAAARAPRLIVGAAPQDKARLDTFSTKLRRFYAEVPDPWFQAEVDYSLAGLQLGPTANDRSLWERYLQDKPVRYDVPAYVRFVGDLFAEHLQRGPFRSHEAELRRCIAEADLPALKALLARNDLLRDDRLNELVLLMELQAQYPRRLFDRQGILACLTALRDGSSYTEHRTIAGNMLRELTRQQPGSPLPAFPLMDVSGQRVLLNKQAEGPTLIALTAGWCTQCEQEIAGLEALYKEFGEAVRFVVIVMEDDDTRFERYVQRNPGRSWTWLRTGDDRTIMDSLQVRSIPSFLMAEDGALALAQAPPPSKGLAGVLHPYAVKARDRRTIRPDRGRPAPKR